MTVLIDPCGGSVDLHQLLPRGGSVLSDLLLVGSNNRADAAWFGNGPDPSRPPYIGVERKRLGDALQCMQDGRWVEQLRGMVTTYNHAWVLIEEEIRSNPTNGLLEKLLHDRSKKTGKRGGGSGTRHFNCNSKCRWVPASVGTKRKLMWRDFRHWLSSLIHVATEESGVIVRHEFTRNPTETADFLWTEYTWWQKDWKDHDSLKVFNTSGPLPNMKPCVCDHPKASHEGRRSKCARCSCDRYEQARTVSTLIAPPDVARYAKETDGVGWDRALALADKFASVRELFNAGADDLVIKGVIGRKLAEGMERQWTRERTIRRPK